MEATAPGNESVNKRKKFLINPEFQTKITMYFVILSLVNILIFYGCIFYFFYHFKSKGVSLGIPDGHVFYTFLGDLKYTMDSIFVVVSVITLSVLFTAGILISHKVAGPLYRLNLHLKSIADSGRLRSISFRKGDFFPEIETSFNDMVEKVDGSDGKGS